MMNSCKIKKLMLLYDWRIYMTNKEKYAKLLIDKCLSIKENQPLLITAPIECIDFVRIVSKYAMEKGVKDIYYDFTDETLKHDTLNYLDIKDLDNSKLFNKSIYDEYAKKNAAFLMLYSDDPDALKDIDNKKIAYSAKLLRTTRPLYKKMQLSYQVSWCIASVVTYNWAKKVLPNSLDPVGDMWDVVLKMTLCDQDDPIKSWDEKINKNKEIVDKLNELKINTLYYKNKLGTDFKISFNDNIWCGASTKNVNGDDIIVNMPTEEVFTTPNKFTANGIVYASKPLVYNSSLIDEFFIEFKDGKVINYDAKVGKDILKSIIEIENGDYLGEVALVDKLSPINRSNILFYETLYDENASCHLALGDGFPECIKSDKSNDELGVNESKTHVDFMIGTDDLEIIAETDNGKILIMKNGTFVI